MGSGKCRASPGAEWPRGTRLQVEHGPPTPAPTQRIACGIASRLGPAHDSCTGVDLHQTPLNYVLLPTPRGRKSLGPDARSIRPDRRGSSEPRGYRARGPGRATAGQGPGPPRFDRGRSSGRAARFLAFGPLDRRLRAKRRPGCGCVRSGRSDLVAMAPRRGRGGRSGRIRNTVPFRILQVRDTLTRREPAG